MEHSFEIAYASPDRYHAIVTFNGIPAEFIGIDGKLYRHDISGTGSIYYSFPSIPDKEDTIELLGWLTDVEELPDVQVDGTNCRHYRGKFDLERMITELATSSKGQAEVQMLEQMRDTIINAHFDHFGVDEEKPQIARVVLKKDARKKAVQ